MNYSFAHVNLNVKDLEKSILFYESMFDLKEVKRIERETYTIVHMKEKNSSFILELTQKKEEKIENVECKDMVHLAFTTKDYDKSYQVHKEKGIIVSENKVAGVYFIEDVDGYWIEIMREK